MNRIIRYFLLFVTLFVSVNSFAQNQQKTDQYVVMISLDAFRWDYTSIARTPNLNAIAKKGVTAQGLIPCYPTKTFPNHYSMATGLHPNNHGIVCNRFFDTELGYYSIGDRQAVENPAFYGGEPIWLTAENQGLKAATFYWVGSEAPIGGKYSSYWKRYDQSIPFVSRIDTLIHWLNLPESERPRLITLYYHEPDAIAHKDGATGPKTIAMVEHLDSLVGVLCERIAKVPYANKINVLIVSDHGMADISPKRYINLSKYVNKDWFDIITGGNPVYSLKPKDQFRRQAIDALKAIPNLKVWERHEIPTRLHYGTNPRIQDVLIEANAGYSIGLGSDSSRYKGATHGYDNQNPDMHGIFFAYGPAFKVGYMHKAFMNTNLYPMIAHILGLTPAKTDGDIKEVQPIFKK
jgi:alkaline phosphatase D